MPTTRARMAAALLVLGLCGVAYATADAEATAAEAQGTPTETRLAVETRDISGSVSTGHAARTGTLATFTVTVASEDGAAATGAVTLVEHGQALAGAALDNQGKAVLQLDSLSAGDHAIHAVYLGDSLHRGSASDAVGVHPMDTSASDYTLSIAPATATLTPGAAATVNVTIGQSGANTAPFTGFLTFSCSGLPQFATCVFAPTTVNVTAAAPTATTVMTLQTEAQPGAGSANRPPNGMRGKGQMSAVAWAAIFPGMLGLAWFARRRGRAGKLLLPAVLGVVFTMGMTACAARYNYYHHGPTVTTGTPAGTYTVTVTSQSSNGVTDDNHSTSFALTVN